MSGSTLTVIAIMSLLMVAFYVLNRLRGWAVSDAVMASVLGFGISLIVLAMLHILGVATI